MFHLCFLSYTSLSEATYGEGISFKRLFPGGGSLVIVLAKKGKDKYKNLRIMFRPYNYLSFISNLPITHLPDGICHPSRWTPPSITDLSALFGKFPKTKIRFVSRSHQDTLQWWFGTFSRTNIFSFCYWFKKIKNHFHKNNRSCLILF